MSKATIKSRFDEGYAYNKQVYLKGRDFGLDPRAWAKLLYVHTPLRYDWNDCPAKLPTWSQATSNKYIVAGLRVAGNTVGALVQHGEHAFDIVGYQTSEDPLIDGVYTLYGFNVIDPCHDAGSYSKYGGTYGLDPDKYVTLSSWNANYFLTYTVQDASDPTWHNDYVVILRSSSGAPQDYPSAPYSDTHGGALIADYETAPDPGYPSTNLGEAVIGGLESNHLIDSNAFGLELSHPTVGASVYVSSVVAGFPSYYLTEVKERGATVALALVEVLADGLHFAELSATEPGFHLPEVAAARAEFAARGFGAQSVSFVWGWSAETMSPFYPAFRGTAADGSRRYLSPGGAISSQLHLTPQSVPVSP
ncbi:MAG: hypothetical protein HY263_03825 [Chloroflexi bacterium]|nr:hypothetical protein [Chloroflexota bacterium]